MNTIFKISLLAICMAVAVASYAAKDFKKEYNESYDISNGAKVELENRYGNMTITTHDKDQVDIHIEVIVDAKNEEKAENIFDRIEIDIYGSTNRVSAKTSIDNNGNIWGKLSGGGSYEIHYDVMVPEHVYLDLQNKYGNISIKDMSNNVKIQLKYGNLSMGDAHDVDISLGYGNGTMGEVYDLDAEVSYGELDITKADDVDIDTKYSKIFIDEAVEMESESKYCGFRIRSARSISNDGKYDNFKIGSIEDITMYTKYTGIDISELHRSANIENAYGGITIDEITENIESIDIENAYSEVKIYNPNDIGFQFNLQTEYGNISVDNGSGDFSDDDNEKWANGKRKGKGNKDAKIKVKNKYGNIKIR